LESKDSGIKFHGLSSLARKLFTQTIFNALSNNVKSNISSPLSFLFLIIVVFLSFGFLYFHIEYYVIYFIGKPFCLTLQMKVSLDIANVLTTFTSLADGSFHIVASMCLWFQYSAKKIRCGLRFWAYFLCGLAVFRPPLCPFQNSYQGVYHLLTIFVWNN